MTRKPEPAATFRVEGTLRWDGRQEGGVVRFARGFLPGARAHMGHRVHALDALQDWIGELQDAYEQLLPSDGDAPPEHEGVAYWRAKATLLDGLASGKDPTASVEIQAGTLAEIAAAIRRDILGESDG